MVTKWCRYALGRLLGVVGCVLDRRIEPVCRFTLHIRGEMGVAVERLADGGVTQPLLDDLRVCARCQVNSRIRMPQIMEADCGHARPLDQLAESQRERVRMNHAATLRREDE